MTNRRYGPSRLTNQCDGVDHINVYSRGKTELGRLLSNFAHTPFEINGRVFQSVEGWWYWRDCRDERMLALYGYQAKQVGRELCAKVKRIQPPTPGELKVIYYAKLRNNPELRAMLLTSVLMFDHYYVYKSGERHETQWRWTGTLWNEVRAELLKTEKLNIP